MSDSTPSENFTDEQRHVNQIVSVSFSPKFSVVLSSCLFILLQLSVIRFYASLVPSISFYKNFLLLSSFLGIGLGFIRRHKLADIYKVGLYTLTLSATLWFLNFTNISERLLSPISEQLHIGFVPGTLVDFAISSLFYTAIFVINALAFIPLGSLCSFYMTKIDSKLEAYSYNILGSILGVLVFWAFSTLWLGPVIWFAAVLLLLTPFSIHSVRSISLTLIPFLLICVLTQVPNSPNERKIFSPYQAIRIRSHSDAPTEIAANGLYFQRVLDLSSTPILTHKEIDSFRLHYNFPFRFQKNLDHVLIVGSGAGNDVAAARRAGSKQIRAVEIDPVILKAGTLLHPEHPYKSESTQAILGDARQFFRTSQEKFDLIVFALLDSHTSLSGIAGGLRLDSYVYTVESFKEARALLKPGGVLTLSFVNMGPQFTKKMYLMLQTAFDGAPPLVMDSGYDYSVTFIAGAHNLTVNNTAIEHVRDVTSEVAAFPDEVNQSTDDWPFLYMTQRVYPATYVMMVSLILLISYIMIKASTSFRLSELAMTPFLLGVAFMLLEAKAVTELSLLYGSVSSVISLTIVAILIAAFTSNYMVLKGWSISGNLAYILLLFSVCLSFSFNHWLLDSIPLTLQMIIHPLILVLPIFFSGFAFSRVLARGSATLSIIFASNLFGALVGGALEYNSMYFGFSSLYLAVFLLYLASWVSELRYR